MVTTQTILDNIEIPGNIVANEATQINPEVAGKITAIYFREGSYVGRGALLAKLNDAELRAQLNKLSVQLRIARQTERRSAQLLEIQGISRQDYDMTLFQVNNIQADMAIINTQLAKTNVRAPYSGKLGLRLVSPGAYVSPQTPVAALDYSYRDAVFLPRINGNSTILFNNNAQKQTLADGSKRDRTGIKSNNINYSLGLNWTVFDGFKMFITREKMGEFIRLGELNIKEQVTLAVSDVIKTYYNIVRQKQQLKAVEEQMSINEDRLKLARYRWRSV